MERLRQPSIHWADGWDIPGYPKQTVTVLSRASNVPMAVVPFGGFLERSWPSQPETRTLLSGCLFIAPTSCCHPDWGSWNGCSNMAPAVTSFAGTGFRSIHFFRFLGLEFQGHRWIWPPGVLAIWERREAPNGRRLIDRGRRLFVR